MAMIKPCCSSFVMDLKPDKPQEGHFTEARQCPTCGEKLKVEFQCAKMPDGSLMCSPVGVS